MGLIHLIILALVQGVTEFLPISSSAHLILAPQVTGQADQGPLIDVMAHLGTLFAVLVFFSREVGEIITGKFALLRGEVTPGGRLVLLIALATPPVLLVGAGLYVTGFADALRDPLVLALATAGFAIPLWLADHFGARVRAVETMSWRDAALIGLAQALAMIPGASRSGVTMTAGRALGYSRTEASRFSMLMAVPVIGALGLLAVIELARGAEPGASLVDGLIVAALSFMVAWAAIALLMRFVERVGFLPFVIYRLLLAGVIIVWLA
ncbi:MAG: undecaprenyl-diphosphate phosphatase [Pseudomonadota bacterium]